jgi:hypothetical protein
MQVHDGEDEYAMRLDAIQNSVWKATNETPVYLIFYFWPHGGVY